ncbi:MAG TPA: hypothetical protein VMG35_03415 [Bryobacteraceae bacterium]|nr:hypothetical protein [Bryobacteraceae bacterium]
MIRQNRIALLLGWMACSATFAPGQSPGGAAASTSMATSGVPRLIAFSGTAKDPGGQPVAGVAGATFSIYRDEDGGVPLWMETQNIQADTNGRYEVQLGSTNSEGLPMELFTAKEARWLGVSVNGAPELPRVLLLSVPYALKAADAQTLGGLPPSAFLPAAPAAARFMADGTASPSATVPALGGTGSMGFLPLWTDSAGDLGNSALFQSGASSAAKIGINTSTPAAALDVKGAALIRGSLGLAATGMATSAAGKQSQPLNFTASAFSSGKSAAVNQTFAWQAEPAGNNSSSPSGTLNLLFGSGASPTETGLQIAGNGQVTFPAGQTFPGTIASVNTAPGSGLMGGGTGANLNLSLLNTCANGQVLQSTGGAWNCATMAGGGTITGVTAGTGLTGGGSNGNVTLNLDTNKVPQLSAANTFTQTQNIVGSLGVGNGTAFTTLQLYGMDSGGTGIQNVTTNSSTSSSSLAVVTATSNAGVTAQMVADGLGTGAMHTPGAYFGTYTNQQVGLVTNNQQRMAITASGQVGIGALPADSTAMLDVNGSSVIRGSLSLPATGTATSGAGQKSQPANLTASAFNSSTSAAVSQTFSWQAEPAGNNTGSPSGTLNLLFGSGATPPTETGLRIAGNGQVTFPAGQTFPGTIGSVTTASGSGLVGGGSGGNLNLSLLNTCANGQVLASSGGAWNCATAGAGTITGVTAGTDLTGGGTGGAVTIGLDTAKVPQLSAANVFTAPQTVKPSLGVGDGTAFSTVQLYGKDSGTTGIQNVTTNSSTSSNSFAVVTATSSAGVTAMMAADGLGTGPMLAPGAYFGTYTNQQVGLITNNKQRAVITPLGQVGIAMDPSSSPAMLEVAVPPGIVNKMYDVQTAAEFTGPDGGDGAHMYGGNDASITGVGGWGASAIGGYSTAYPGYGGVGIYAVGGHGWTESGLAGDFGGDVAVVGNLSKSGGSFKIDHPLDPANKYLYHSFVESPDMMNIYNGIATLDASGETAVVLPAWFETLNRDFRYQLTAIGAPGPNLYIASEISQNSFRIAGGKPGMRVSWQVTGIRQDAWANAHRIPLEEDKPEPERGFYLHPELYGAPEEKSIDWARYPRAMQRLKAARAKATEPSTR